LDPEEALTPRLGLRRTGSQDSLNSMVSLATEQIISSATVKGELQLCLSFQDAQARKPAVIVVLVEDATTLEANHPYVKVYISRNGVDMKPTKVKGRHGAKNRLGTPLQLEVPVPKEVETKPGSYRLQLSIWDHGRLKANECTGGMSFPLTDILGVARLEGWFQLLPYQRGRCNSQKVAAPDQRSVALSQTSRTSFEVGSSSSQDVAPRSAVHATAPRAAVALPISAAHGADLHLLRGERAASPAVASTDSGEPPQLISEHRAPGLRRTGSMGSLVSVASGNVVQSSIVQGKALDFVGPAGRRGREGEREERRGCG
jgi:hypothetical protein